MPMAVFLDCLCDENYSSLIIEGTAPESELREAWIFILSEYYDLRGDMDGLEQWRLSRDISRLQNHLFLVGLCVESLTKKYSESVAGSLNYLGYFFFPENKQPVKYIDELTAVVNQSKTKYIELQQLIKQQKERVEKVHTNKKPDREHYDSMLIEIEEMQRTNYSFDTLFVSKFITLEKKYWKLVEHLKSKVERNG